MQRMIAFSVLVLALLCGLAASFIVMKILQEAQKSKPVEIVKTTPIVIAKSEILAGSTISASQLAMKDFPKDDLLPGVYDTQQKLIGRVVKSTIFPGEPIFESRLQETGAIPGLPSLIPKGFRAITLRVDDTTGVAGFVRPGCYVDVITTFDKAGTIEEPVSKVILQNIKVIAAGQEVETSTAENKNADPEKKAKVISTITVVATIQQAECLSLASNSGTIRLVLRNNTDIIEEMTKGVTLSSIFPESARFALPKPERAVIAPVATPTKEPTPTPKPSHTVQVYRGKEVTDMKFEE